MLDTVLWICYLMIFIDILFKCLICLFLWQILRQLPERGNDVNLVKHFSNDC